MPEVYCASGKSIFWFAPLELLNVAHFFPFLKFSDQEKYEFQGSW